MLEFCREAPSLNIGWWRRSRNTLSSVILLVILDYPLPARSMSDAGAIERNISTVHGKF
jgi:hypothetical protein